MIATLTLRSIYYVQICDQHRVIIWKMKFSFISLDFSLVRGSCWPLWSSGGNKRFKRGAGGNPRRRAHKTVCPPLSPPARKFRKDSAKITFRVFSANRAARSFIFALKLDIGVKPNRIQFVSRNSHPLACYNEFCESY